MSDKNVQSNVSSVPPRKTGDAPGIGRVARIRSTPPGSGKSAKGEEALPASLRTFGNARRIRKLEHRSFFALFWLTAMILGCCAVLIGGIMLWLRSQGDRKQIANPGAAQAVQRPVLQITDFPPPTEAAVVSMLRGALAARDEETLQLYVRESDEVPPPEMLAFLAETAGRDGTLESHRWVGAIDHPSLQVQGLRATFEKDDRITARIAMLVPDSAGNWRIDFPTFARWCDPPIQLLDTPEGHPGGRLRAFIQADTYYNGPFASDREWMCLRISSPDCENTAYGYVALGTPVHKAVLSLITPENPMVPVTLEIERREGAEARQFAISRVLANGWILTDEPYDSLFN